MSHSLYLCNNDPNDPPPEDEPPPPSEETEPIDHDWDKRSDEDPLDMR